MKMDPTNINKQKEQILKTLTSMEEVLTVEMQGINKQVLQIRAAIRDLQPESKPVNKKKGKPLSPEGRANVVAAIRRRAAANKEKARAAAQAQK